MNLFLFTHFDKVIHFGDLQKEYVRVGYPFENSSNYFHLNIFLVGDVYG
jgi:hypothetical protein